ncbi:MAG: efflux transporter outer membrane subunit [Candidatus Competibacteraceae bacterium]
MNKAYTLVCWMVLGWLPLGCTVGPDYQTPATPVPTTWQGLTVAATAPTSVPTTTPVQLVEWWKAFHDPTLSSLVNRAITANLDLRQAQARVRQARASLGVAGAGLWPTVDASGRYSRSYNGSISSGNSGGASLGAGGNTGTGSSGGYSRGSPEARDLFQVGLDASWELDLFGGVRRNIEAGEADLQAAEEDRRDVLVSLIAEVGNNYLNLRGLQQQLAIARQNLEAQQHTAEITRKRYEAGFVDGLDVANANAQVATTAAQIPPLESSAQATVYSLSILLGAEPATLVRELTPTAAIPPTPPTVPVGLPSDLLRRRPDIRRAEAQLHAATARIGVATADLFPRFSLSGSLGLSGNNLSALTDWRNRSWSIGPTVSWPVFDAGRIRWNIELQNALQEQDLAAYQKTVLTALKDVETALVAYAKEQEHGRLLTEAVANDRKAVDLAMQLYVAGKTDFLNVLNAQRALFLAEDALVQSTRSLSTNLIALYKALGGGWENQSDG